ncbi:MAG: electron transfer flavoprotein subunit beta/FixA family protein [Pseudomonadota bacterium]
MVCIKQVPGVTGEELEIKRDSSGIETEDLEMDISEWDNYAIEAAIRLKESHGGKVTVVTLGDEDSEDVLRQALAMGADNAILIDAQGFEGSDAAGIAKGLYAAVKPLSFDLLLTGVQSSDEGWGQVGGILAELLEVPSAALVVGIESGDKTLTVLRELENNTLEKVKLPFPAVLTVQTGINDPRYVSIMGIQKAKEIEITETDASDLGIKLEEIGLKGSGIASRVLSLPVVGDGAEFLEGSIDEICDKIGKIIKDKAGMV